jgi:hypothetical protein
MPPSGYTAPQSKSIIEFAKSVSHSLEEEGRSFHLTPVQALQFEIDNINVILEAKEFGEIENKVLELTSALYQKILDRNPVDYQDFDKIRNALLEEANAQILKIHVPTINPLSPETREKQTSRN